MVYKPVSIGSIYFDAGTSFNPSAESLSLSASTANLPPEKNRTYEFGTQVGFPAQPVVAARGGFPDRETQCAESRIPPIRCLNVLAGTQRVNGAQVEVRAHLTSRWDLLGSYANLDGKADQLQLLSGGDRRAARQRAAQHLQLLEHATACPGAGRRASAGTTSPAARPARPRRSIQ